MCSLEIVVWKTDTKNIVARVDMVRGFNNLLLNSLMVTQSFAGAERGKYVFGVPIAMGMVLLMQMMIFQMM